MKDFLILIFLCIPVLMNAQFHSLGKELPCVDKEFKVFAHIGVDELGNTDFTEQQVLDAVEAINKYFEPICVSFAVCDIEIMQNYNFNIPQEHLYEEMHAVHGRPHVIDVYFCYMQVGGPLICGAHDGTILFDHEGAIFLNKVCTEALAHEMGHIFGLLDTYTFGNNNTLVDNSNCETSGDFICDTPSDPYDGSGLIYFLDGCNFIYPGVDPNGDFYVTEVGNIMSPYLDCYCGFSRGQFLKMVETFNDSPHIFW